MFELLVIRQTSQRSRAILKIETGWPPLNEKY